MSLENSFKPVDMADKKPEYDRLRRRLFESLYGYPLRLAEQVVDGSMLNHDIKEDFVAYHNERIETIDLLFKDMGFNERTAQLPPDGGNGK